MEDYTPKTYYHSKSRLWLSALVWIFARLWVRPQRLSNYYVNKSQFEFNNKNKDSTFLAFLQFFSEFMLFYVGIYNATVFLEFVLYRRDRHQVIILSTYFVLTEFFVNFDLTKFLLTLYFWLVHPAKLVDFFMQYFHCLCMQFSQEKYF